MTVHSKISSMQLAMAVLSGLLLFLSFPKFGSGFLAWVALIPLFYALKDAQPREGLKIGFLFGFIAHVGILYWIAYVVVQYGYLPLYTGISAMLLLAVYMGFYTAAFSMGVAYFQQRCEFLIISAPLLWTVLEFARSHLFTGFPWENLAYSQYQYGKIIQISDITGVYGITFTIVMINAFLFVFLQRKNQKRHLLAEALAIFAIISTIYGYGQYRTADIRRALSRASGLEVSLIQGNIDQNIKWSPEHQKETLDIYRSVTLAAAPAAGGLIVWPETATPFYFQRLDPLQASVIDVARTSKAALLFGSPSYAEAGGRIDYMNSAFLLRPDGVISGRYDKVHLVPYGEYVPLRKFFPFMDKIVVGVGDFKAGKGFYPLTYEGRRLGVLICYEAIFPEGARSYKREGADILVNITNDAWFGRTSAPYQHLSMTVFRAIETRLPLVRAANTGMSAIIDPTGEIQSRTPIFERTFLKGEVKIIDEKTFYTAYGNLFVYLCGIFLLILFISTRERSNGNAGRNS
jgi:apolipoprotein N-acyltransferase